MRSKYLFLMIVAFTILFGTHATSASQEAASQMSTGAGVTADAVISQTPVQLKNNSSASTAEKNYHSAIEGKVTTAAEKRQARCTEIFESKKPMITGAASIKINYNGTFPIASYSATNTRGEALTPTLYVGINSKKLGAQVAIVEAEDTVAATKKFLLVNVTVVDVTKPIISGQKNLSTTAGTTLNLLSGVHAVDAETGDLTKTVTQKNPVNFNRAGTYPLLYEVRDSSGNVGQAKSTLTVKAVAQVTNTSSSTTVGTQSATAGTISSASPAISSQLAASSIYLAGIRIPYINGGTASGYQAINANPYGLASTYYGSSFNGSDSRYTHFIGHSPGIFTPVKSLGVGSKVTVTNDSGTAFVYTVSRVVDLTMRVESDGFAYPTTPAGQDMIDALYYGEVSGETIVLQTCTDDDGSLIRFVYANR